MTAYKKSVTLKEEGKNRMLAYKRFGSKRIEITCLREKERSAIRIEGYESPWGAVKSAGKWKAAGEGVSGKALARGKAEEEAALCAVNAYCGSRAAALQEVKKGAWEKTETGWEKTYEGRVVKRLEIEEEAGSPAGMRIYEGGKKGAFVALGLRGVKRADKMEVERESALGAGLNIKKGN